MLKIKKVNIIAVPENQPRCAVFLLDLYMLMLPQFAFEKDIFFLRPKATVPFTGPWYENVAIGKNKLASFVKDMFLEAGFDENYKTNHSLRATSATALFKSRAPEKIIQKTTGHRSVEVLRQYERTSVEKEHEACCILTSTDRSNTSYSIEEHQ